MSQVVELKLHRKSTPPIVNGQVPPRRQPNAAVRKREYLTPKEIELLMKGAGNKCVRHSHRDATAILIAYRHALRVSELVGLRWSDVDFDNARLNVRRVKGSADGVHLLEGDELRALRRLQRDNAGGEFCFLSERGGSLTAGAVGGLVRRAARNAGLTALKVHPHMLRHACGYKLANQGTDTRIIQDYMGHRNIQNTVGYTKLNANRFRNLWAK